MFGMVTSTRPARRSKSYASSTRYFMGQKHNSRGEYSFYLLGNVLFPSRNKMNALFEIEFGGFELSLGIDEYTWYELIPGRASPCHVVCLAGVPYGTGMGVEHLGSVDVTFPDVRSGCSSRQDCKYTDDERQ